MGGTRCRGRCSLPNGSLIAKKGLNIRNMRGSVRKEDKGKTPKKCSNCEIKIFDFEGNNCPCCNNLFRLKPKYKPKDQIHRLDDNKNKLRMTRMVQLEDGSKVEIVKVVVLPKLPVLYSPVLVFARSRSLNIKDVS